MTKILYFSHIKMIITFNFNAFIHFTIIMYLLNQLIFYIRIFMFQIFNRGSGFSLHKNTGRNLFYTFLEYKKLYELILKIQVFESSYSHLC